MPDARRRKKITHRLRRRSSKSMCEYALKNAELGWHVVPLETPKDAGCSCYRGRDCGSPGKHPISSVCPHGHLDGTDDPEVIKQWWRRYPHANIGVVTREASGVFVIDVDKRPDKDGMDTLKQLGRKFGKLPLDCVVKTGSGGLHMYLSHPGGDLNQIPRDHGAGIDVKAEGLVVAPPSIHACGKRYVGKPRYPTASLPPMPSSWRKLLQTKQAKHGRSARRTLKSRVTEGQRNVYIFKTLCLLRRGGASDDLVVLVGDLHNKHECAEPLGQKELAGITRSVLKQELSIEHLGDPHAIAKYLIDEHYSSGEVSTLRFFQGSIWQWHRGRYQQLAGDEFKARLNRMIRRYMDHHAVEKMVGGQLVNNVMSAIQGMVLVPGTISMPRWIGEEKPSGSGELLSMANGLLDLDAVLASKKKVLHKPSPHWFAQAHWGFEYRLQAKCPHWTRYLKRVVPDLKVRRLLQEYVGYALTIDTSLHRFLVLVGEGANGKSVFTEVVSNVLGVDNVAHLGIERLGEWFATASLYDKLANIVSEIGITGGVAIGMFKAIVAGDRIELEQKLKAPFEARLYSRFIFATNQVPTFVDGSDGLWRRMLLVEFGQTIPVKQQDRGLAKRIIGRELPGVFNWALTGLRRLRERGDFDVPAVVAEAVREQKHVSNPTQAFLEEHAKEAPQAKIACSVLYARYRAWAEASGYHAKNEANFGREVRRIFPGVERKQERVTGGRAYFYHDIRDL